MAQSHPSRKVCRGTKPSTSTFQLGLSSFRQNHVKKRGPHVASDVSIEGGEIINKVYFRHYLADTFVLN